MAQRLLKTLFVTAVSKQYWCRNSRGLHITNSIIRNPRTISSSLCGVNSFCSKAAARLSRSLEDELKQEVSSQVPLPRVRGFDLSVKGAIATFLRQHNNEVITVSLDANKLVPMNDDEYINDDEEYDDDDDDEYDDEFEDEGKFDNDEEFDEEEFEDEESNSEKQVMYPSMLLIDVKKSSGDRLQFHCTIDCLSDKDPYTGDLMIENMCYIPAGMDADSVYLVSNFQASDNLLGSFYEYLKSRGINETFVKETLLFAQKFQDSLYVTDFVKRLKNFV